MSIPPIQQQPTKPHTHTCTSTVHIYLYYMLSRSSPRRRSVYGRASIVVRCQSTPSPLPSGRGAAHCRGQTVIVDAVARDTHALARSCTGTFVTSSAINTYKCIYGYMHMYRHRQTATGASDLSPLQLNPRAAGAGSTFVPGGPGYL